MQDRLQIVREEVAYGHFNETGCRLVLFVTLLILSRD